MDIHPLKQQQGMESRFLPAHLVGHCKTLLSNVNGNFAMELQTPDLQGLWKLKISAISNCSDK